MSAPPKDCNMEVAIETPPETPIMENMCRTCLGDLEMDDKKANIFEKSLKDDEEGALLVAECLKELFPMVEFKRNLHLPDYICGRCMNLTYITWTFRGAVLEVSAGINAYIEKEATMPTTTGPYSCPEAVEFDPALIDNNCTVIELNPNDVCDTSDDDFSMDSDTDSDDSTIATPGTTANTSTPLSVAKPLVVPVESAVATPAGVLNISELGVQSKNTFMCQYCDIAFATQADCMEHELLHDPQAPYLCNFCSMRHQTRANLIAHIKAIHDAERPFICAVCNKGFSRRPDLKKHTIVHTGVRPFTCSLCNKSFSRNTNLNKHLRIHQSVKPFVCQSCPRSYSTEIELTQHARTHSEVKPFNCNRCGASFARRDKYLLHEQSHYRRDSEFLRNQGKVGGGESADYPPQGGQMESMVVPLNPFATEADAGVMNPTLLEDPTRGQVAQQQPQRAAAAPKPSKFSRNFNCPVCSKSFTRERDLHRHSALHMDTLFTCKDCGLSFNRREKLTRHEVLHHPAQTIRCQLCAAVFPTIELLAVHVRNHQQQPQQQVALTTATAIQMDSSNPMAIPSAIMAPAPTMPSMQMNLGFYSETRPDERNGI